MIVAENNFFHVILTIENLFRTYMSNLYDTFELGMDCIDQIGWHIGRDAALQTTPAQYKPTYKSLPFPS